MKQSFTKQDIVQIAKVYRLPVSPQETQNVAARMPTVYQHLYSFKNLVEKAKNFSPTHHTANIKNVSRKDIVKSSLKPKDVFLNTINRRKNYFAVPQVLEKL